MYDFNQASSHIIYEANDQGNHEEDIMQLLLVKLAKSKVYHKKSFAEKIWKCSQRDSFIHTSISFIH
jgi:hypothetical protein